MYRVLCPRVHLIKRISTSRTSRSRKKKPNLSDKGWNKAARASGGVMRSTDRIGAGPYARLAETPRRKAGALSYANTKNLPEAEIHR